MPPEISQLHDTCFLYIVSMSYIYDIISIICLLIIFAVPAFHISLLIFILTLLLFAFFKVFVNVAATSYFQVSRLIPASIVNLHFIHLLQITNEYVKHELPFYYTSSSSNCFSLLEILSFVNYNFYVLTHFHSTWQCLGWMTVFEVAVLVVIHACFQAVRWHRCFRICLQKIWENNIFSQFSLLSIFSYSNGWAFKYRNKCQNLPALAGMPVHLCKPDRTDLLQLFHTY